MAAYTLALIITLGLALIATARFAFLARKSGWLYFWLVLMTAIGLLAIGLFIWPGWLVEKPVGHAVEVLPYRDWPHMNGRNTTEMVTAPANGYVLVQYGYEARLENKEVPGCGLALVAPGATVNLTVWDGNAEVLRGTAEAIKAYAESELAARQANEGRCQTWTVTGLEYTSTATDTAGIAFDETTVTDSPCGAEYVVQPGDGRLRIAQRCERTWSEIAVANDLPDDYALHPGAVLRIP